MSTCLSKDECRKRGHTSDFLKHSSTCSMCGTTEGDEWDEETKRMPANFTFSAAQQAEIAKWEAMPHDDDGNIIWDDDEEEEVRV